MIVFLRSVGFLNAAIWLGAAVLFTFGTSPALTSQEMKDLLGPRNYPYFSAAVGHVVEARYYHLHLICALVAMLHLMAEWLYLGKVPRKFWRGLLAGMLLAILVNGYWLQPRMKQLNTTRFAAKVTLERRDAAARSYRAWGIVYRGINLLLVGALAAYFWRVSNPSDPARFVSAVKFRS